MDTDMNKSAFLKNERQANVYMSRCMLVFALVVVFVWILNILGVFIVPETIMTIAAVSGIVLLSVPWFVCRFVKGDAPWLKVLIMVLCVLGICILSCAMPKHSIIAWVAPMALSCHYYSKKYTYITVIISVVFMSVSIILAAYFGEWDVSIFGEMQEDMPLPREVSAEVYRRMFLYIILPRGLTLLGIGVVCSTLADRTHKLLEQQIKDSRSKQEIESELKIATHIQTSMLPRNFPAFPRRDEIDIYADMKTAKEVGGDFYDFYFADEDKLCVLIADVSGKGIPAAMFMMSAKTIIKGYVESGKSVSETLTLANSSLCENNDNNMFVTIWLGIIDLKTGIMEFANAGHNPPLLKRADGAFEYMDAKKSLVLAAMEGMSYEKNTVKLLTGDKLYLYTDGVTEAMNRDEEFYSEKRLRETLNKSGNLPPIELCEKVYADVQAFSGEAPQFDDITMLCLEYKK